MTRDELRKTARALAASGVEIYGSGGMRKPSRLILAGEKARKQIAAWRVMRAKP